jgi:hypothetical protein
MALSGTDGMYSAPAAASDTDPGGGLLTGGSLPRIVKVDSSTGCTLTRAQVKGLTPNEFADLANKETDLARVIANAAEAKALGVEERGLATLLTSSVTNIKPLLNKVNVAEQSIILPYIQRRQRSLINANYFAVEAGSAASTALGTGTIPAIGDFKTMSVGGATGQGEHGQNPYGSRADDWCVTVSMGGSDWKTPLDNIERYFILGSYVIINGWDAATGDAFDSQFEVVGTANDSASTATVPKAHVILRPVGADVPKAGLVGANAGHGYTHYKPTLGIVQTIANNVNDYEAWCYNQPTDLSVRLLVNWLQTTRETRIVNQEYKETLAKIMDGKVNPFLNSMVYNPLAEQNRIAAQVSQDQWTRATWYNQAIAKEQTPEGYFNLPTVADPEDGNCTLEYKANALGIKTLLYEGNRVKDNLGQNLNLDSLFGDLYYLKRNREQDGDRISVIDCMTDRVTANLIFEAMNKYYKDKYDWAVTRNVGINEKVTHNGIILFQYNIYDIPEVGVQLAVFHDPMFDDLLNASSQYSTAMEVGGASTTYAKSRNRALWLVDWSDVKIGIAGSNSVTRKSPSPEVDRLYRCRMDSVEREYSLRSTKWTTMLDRPHRHLIIENFDEGVTVTAAGSTITKTGSLTYNAPVLEGYTADTTDADKGGVEHGGGSQDDTE